MTMTDREFAQLVLEVNGTWTRGDRIGPTTDGDVQGEARLAAFHRHLHGLDYAVATSALSLLVHDGREWIPDAPAVLAAVKRLSGPVVLPFDEAWPIIRRHIKRYRGERVVVGGAPGERRTIPSNEPEIVAWVRGDAGAPVARFVSAYGVKRLGEEQVDHPKHGGAVMHRLREAYDKHMGVAEEGAVVRAALGSGVGPRRLDAIGALGLERGEREEAEARRRGRLGLGVRGGTAAP